MGESLYSISSDLKEVIENGIVFDEETGEIYFDETDIDALSASMARKVEAVSMYAAGRRALAKARKEAAKSMQESAKALETEADKLDGYALRCVREVGGRVETESMTVSVRKCPPSVEVLDEKAIPKEYVKKKVETSINKTAIKKAINSGIAVPGACLVQNEKLTIK